MNQSVLQNQILISISCVVYNQEDYLEKCLEGFLMQQTSFNFEVLINDDASTDNSVEILKYYENRFPEKIKVIYQDENKFSKFKGGMHMRFNFPRAKGKYIAMCDGDDYWINPYKLQNQIDFLERNMDFVIHHTNYKVLIDNGKLLKSGGKNQSIERNFLDLLKGNFIVNSSVVFRKVEIKSIPGWVSNVFAGDWAFYLFLTRSGGKIFYDETPSVVYRKNVGIFKNYKNPLLNLTKILELKKILLNDPLFQHQENQIKSSINETKMNIMAAHVKNGDYFRSFSFFASLFIKDPKKTIRIFAYSVKLRLKNK